MRRGWVVGGLAGLGSVSVVLVKGMVWPWLENWVLGSAFMHLGILG